MSSRNPRAARALVRLSVAIAAQFPHDAGAAGRAVQVTDQQALAVLRRSLLRVLSTKCEPHLEQVSEQVAAALSGTDLSTSEGQRFYVAVGLGRQGQSAFLLRAISDKEDCDGRRREEKRMLDDLQRYLAAVL